MFPHPAPQFNRNPLAAAISAAAAAPVVPARIKDRPASNDAKIALPARTRDERAYQQQVVQEVAQALEAGHRRILVIMPTASGKTYTSKLVFNSDNLRGLLGIEGRPIRVLFIAHKSRILSQARAEYAADPGIEFIAQSAYQEIPQAVMEKGWDVSCLDEAHHEAMMTIQYRLDTIKERPMIGFTATPDRHDGRLIKFSHIIEPLTRQQGVELGVLAETHIHSIVDVGGVDKRHIIKDVLQHFRNSMGKTIIFVRTRQEVMEIHAFLDSLGEASFPILDNSDKEVDRVLDEFSMGKWKFLVNCSKLDEGIDVRGCTDVFIGRQCGSKPVLNQIIGRGARPDSECNVWELVDPLKDALCATDIIAKPKSHRLYFKKQGAWQTGDFEIV